MTITKEGTLVSFYTVNKAPIKHLRVYFSPKQAGEGDPSPENIRAITGMTGLEIYHTGKNIYNKNARPLTDGWYFNANSGEGANSTSNMSGTINFVPIQGLGGKQITLNQRPYGNNPGFGFYTSDSTATYISGIKNNSQTAGTPWTVTVPENAKYMRFTTVRAAENVQIEIGSESTSYDSYKGYNINTINWSSTLGTIYGGYVDLITGELTVQYKLCTITGDENNLIYNWDGCLLPVADSISNNQNYGILACSHTNNKVRGIDIFNTSRSTPDANTTLYDICVANSSGYQLRFRKRDLDPNYTSDITLYKNWLKAQNANGTPLQIVYQLETPITYQLTPQQLETFIGKNNIWSNADRVEVEYDLAESNDELYRRRSIILQSAPHLETASGTIAHFNTDLINNLQSAKFYFNPIQEGTGDPSPTNIREITGHTGMNITACGINLLHCTMDTYNANGVKVIGYRNSNEKIIKYEVSGTATKASNLFMNLNYTQNEYHWPPYGLNYATYSYSSKANIGIMSNASPPDRNGDRDNNFNWLYYDNLTPSNTSAEWLRIQMLPYNIQNIDCTTTIYPMLCLQEDAGCTFEPYNGQNISLNWTNEIGMVYGGYIDLIKGQLIATMGKYTIDQNTVFYKSTNSPTSWIRIEMSQSGALPIKQRTVVAQYNGELCDKIEVVQGIRPKTRPAVCIGTYESGIFYNNIYIFDLDKYNTSITTSTDLENYLRELAPTFVYPIEPITYQLSPIQLKTLKGTNNIWSNANGPVEISYWTH